MISIGLQLDIDANTITLTIAESDPVCLETVQYARKTLALLCDCSEAFANDRAGQARDWGGQSVPSHLTPAERIIASLAEHV